MGMVFGKIDVEEPKYSVLLSRSESPISYEVREYNKRFAIETIYGDGSDDGSPFMKLAGYIGVMSDPQNEGGTKIAMTAPVAIESDNKKGEAIDMTAPVAIKGSEGGKKKMQFILPSEYDEMGKIPKPTNPDVTVHELPPAVGAVHRFTGAFNEERSRGKAAELISRLKADGVNINEVEALENFQFWGYNPPFTIPFMRRNEVWIELTQKQVHDLTSTFSGAEATN